AAFGRFSIIYSILLFCNILQSTLITQAHNVLGTARSGLAYRRYTSSTGLGQLVLIALVALLAMPFAAASSWSGSALAPLLWALLPSIVAWQLQEFVRRVLYTEGRYGAASFNDIISYGGQTVVLAALYVAGRSWGYTLTGSMALYVLAATSALAAVVGLWQLRHSLTLDAHWSDLHENWHFGKWLLGGELMQWASSLQMQILWAALLLSMSASADLRAVQILFGPTRVIAFFLGTVLPIRFARTLHSRGMGAMRGLRRRPDHEPVVHPLHGDQRRHRQHHRHHASGHRPVHRRLSQKHRRRKSRPSHAYRCGPRRRGRTALFPGADRRGSWRARRAVAARAHGVRRRRRAVLHPARASVTS